jgi:hypothetical protein
MPEYDDADRAMDARLRSHADAWREQVDGATGPELLPPTRGAWLAPLAVAVTVAAIVGVTFTVHGVGGNRAPIDHPTTTAAPKYVVPWRDLPATSPKLPVTTTPPTPSPPQIAATRACTPSDVQLVASGSPDGATGGVLYTSAELRIKGAACRLNAGYPLVSALRAGHSINVPITNEHASDLPVDPVLLAKGSPASITVVFSTHQCPAARFDEFLVRFPQLNRQIRLQGPFRSFCNPGEGSNTIHVWPIRSENPPHPVVDSPFDDLRAKGNLDLTVAPGERARFVITLTSHDDLPLVPCPDYAVHTSLGEQHFGLNCDGVPFRDSKGRPFLPAGQQVRFAMEAQTGGQDTDKFIWQLLTPLGRKNVVGSITIDGS